MYDYEHSGVGLNTIFAPGLSMVLIVAPRSNCMEQAHFQ